MQTDNPTYVFSFHFLHVILDKNIVILVWDSILERKA